MAEVFAQFADLVTAADGQRYRAQACGAPMTDGLWEGWIEFVPLEGGAALRSPRETTQPNAQDTAYWASGLTAVYLEGALSRALRPLVRKAVTPAAPVFDGPAEGTVVVPDRPAVAADAVLDPFSVFEKGEGLLRRELGALSAWHLVNIIVAYRLSDEPIASLNRLPAVTLIEVIVAGVRRQQPVR